MKYNSYKGFNKKRKLKYSSFNSFGNTDKLSVDNESIDYLRWLRIVVVILAIAVVVCAIAVGLYLYSANNSALNKSSIYTPKKTSEELIRVVNRNNSLSKSFVPELQDYEGYSVCTLAYDDLKSMLDDANSIGTGITLRKAYVSYSDQGKAYKSLYKKYIAMPGVTQVRAQAKTQVITPEAGNSEYQTGLLFYFDSKDKYSNFASTKAFKWLDKNAKDYGFVLRYTTAKESITTMKGSNHIFRYVGKENSKLMQSLNMCLDEYNDYVNSR